MRLILLAVANLLNTLEGLFVEAATWLGRSLVGLLTKLVTRPIWVAGRFHWILIGLLIILIGIGEALEIWRRVIEPLFQGTLL